MTRKSPSIKKATEFLPWKNDDLHGYIGEVFEKAVSGKRVDRKTLVQLTEFVQDHNVRCQQYGPCKLGRLTAGY